MYTLQTRPHFACRYPCPPTQWPTAHPHKPRWDHTPPDRSPIVAAVGEAVAVAPRSSMHPRGDTENMLTLPVAAAEQAVVPRVAAGVCCSTKQHLVQSRFDGRHHHNLHIALAQ